MLDYFEKKIKLFPKTVGVIIAIICAISLLIRLYYLPYDIPLTLDALYYFWYANDISILGNFPDYTIFNDGWPIFLSPFFSIVNFNNFMDYMLLQRIIAVSISVLTIIPVYILCRRFFDKSYSLVGASIFAFEPHIIQNSLLGITEPLYLILITISLVFFFSKNEKLVYASFFVVALSTMIRTEGIFLFFAFSILFFVFHKKEIQTVGKYLIVLGVYILSLIPITVTRLGIAGSDPAYEKIEVSATNLILSVSEGGQGLSFLYDGMINLIKFLGWDLIPVFIFFVPIGFILLLKSWNKEGWKFIIVLILLIFPAFYAYSTEAFDTRYLFALFPMFSVLSLFTIKSANEKFGSYKVFLLLIIIGIILVSNLFLELQKPDLTHQSEALSIAYEVADKTKVINQYLPESSFLPIVGLSQLDYFPILKSNFNDDDNLLHCAEVLVCNAILNIKANSLEEYIEEGRKKRLTHLVLDGTEHFRYGNDFFIEVFHNEEKYPYLVKEFDSKDLDYKYHLKIFKVDYEVFDSRYG